MITWAVIKSFCISRNLSIQFIDLGAYYWLKAFDGIFEVEFNLIKDSGPDQIDFESGLMLTGNKAFVQSTATKDVQGNTLNQYDVDKALVVRAKAAKSGWTYGALAFEFKTSSRTENLVALNYDGSTKPWITIHLFDAQGLEITDPAKYMMAIRTQVDFEPPYDYELIGGEMRINPQLTSNVRFFIVAVPDVPYAYGGSRVMAEGLNIKYLAPGNMFSVDGRVSKLLSYSATNHTNKLRFLFWHDMGVTEDLMITVEHYRL
jgi:hypothetical protein